MAIQTGVYRELDALGRVVIPKELRDVMGIAVGDSLEVFVDNDQVILRKYERGCTFCGNMDTAFFFKGKMVCDRCKRQLNELLDAAPVL